MSNIKVNVKEVLGTVSAEQIEALNPAATEAMEKLHKGTGAGSDFLVGRHRGYSQATP